MSIRDSLVKRMGGPAKVKLNIARACLDMGDRKQARTLLNEILLEGTEAEKKAAEGLLARIS